MSFELTLVVWSALLFALYIGVQSTLYRMQHGVKFANTARDNEAPPNPMNARAEKALRNFLETYGLFVALALAAAVAGKSNGLTQWGAGLYYGARIVYLPLYLIGIPQLRSLAWVVSLIGLILLFFGVVL
jgi:uncharacterized MAPEG superfamily protein